MSLRYLDKARKLLISKLTSTMIVILDLTKSRIVVYVISKTPTLQKVIHRLYLC